MNVVDIGCYWHPEHQGQSQDSIGRLIERFHPLKVIGYDPQLPEGISEGRALGTVVVLWRRAVWNSLRMVTWLPPQSPLSAKVGQAELIGADDIADVVRDAGQGCVVKIDAEGGEYELLKRLHETGTDKMISLLLVEWHGDPRPDLVDCPVEVWK